MDLPRPILTISISLLLHTSIGLSAESEGEAKINLARIQILNSNHYGRLSGIGSVPSPHMDHLFLEPVAKDVQIIDAWIQSKNFEKLTQEEKDIVIHGRRVSQLIAKYRQQFNDHAGKTKLPRAADYQQIFLAQLELRKGLLAIFDGESITPPQQWKHLHPWMRHFLSIQAFSYPVTYEETEKIKLALSRWPDLFKKMMTDFRSNSAAQFQILRIFFQGDTERHLFHVEAQRILASLWNEGVISQQAKKKAYPYLRRSIDTSTYEINFQISPQDFFSTIELKGLRTQDEKAVWIREINQTLPSTIPEYLQTQVNTIEDFYRWILKLVKPPKNNHPLSKTEDLPRDFDRELHLAKMALNYNLDKSYYDVMFVLIGLFKGDTLPGYMYGFQTRKDNKPTEVSIEKEQTAKSGGFSPAQIMKTADFHNSKAIINKLVNLFTLPIHPMFAEFNLKLLRDFLYVADQLVVFSEVDSRALQPLFHYSFRHQVDHPRIREIAERVLQKQDYSQEAKLAAVNYLLRFSVSEQQKNALAVSRKAILQSFPKIKSVASEYPGLPTQWQVGDTSHGQFLSHEIKEVFLWQSSSCADLLRGD